MTEKELFLGEKLPSNYDLEEWREKGGVGGKMEEGRGVGFLGHKLVT